MITASMRGVRGVAGLVGASSTSGGSRQAHAVSAPGSNGLAAPAAQPERGEAASSVLCLGPLQYAVPHRAGGRRHSQGFAQRRWCTTDTTAGGDAEAGSPPKQGQASAGKAASSLQSSAWKTMRTGRQESADLQEEEVVVEERVPKTFKEYLQYCKIIGALDVPSLLMKEGKPDRTQDIMELLEDLKILHLLNDEGCFYLVLVGWMGDIMKHRFRVFTAAEREKQWKVMMKWLNGVEDQWGPKTTAALMQVASTAGLTEACITLYFDATKKGYATRYVLPSVVYALGKSGKMSHLDNAREVFNFCAENSFRREDYVAFIHANARQGNWRDARYYFEAFRKDFPHVSNKGTSSPQEAKLLTTLLAAYSRGRNPTGALELYQEFSEKYRLSDMQCSAMISAYADGSVRGYNAARMTFLRSYDITYTPSATAWMKVMTALAQSLHDTCLGEPRDAVEKMMLLNIRQGNDYIQTTQFQGRARYRYRHLKHRFWKLYEILKAYPSHYQPDHVTYYQSLKFAMVTEDPQAAMMVLDDAEKQGIRHTVFFNLAIGAHAKAMDVKGVLELFKKLRERKLVPDIGTYASIVQSLGPGVGTNNAVAVVENITKANMKMSSTFLAGCVRAFSTSGGMQHMAEVLRKGVTLSSGDDESDYVLDNPFLWHNLELAFLDTSILNQFHVEYPDFNERVFEVLGGPLQHFRSPRPVATNIDDFKQIFSVASGKSVWVMTDEWILPLGDRLREYIEDVLKAKDKVVIPFYCLLRLGKIVRRNSRNSLMREMAFKSLTVLQELFDESAEQAARGENVTVDTVYFTEEQWARSRLVSVLERQGLTERDLETLEKFKETPVVYDLELRSSAPVSDIPTVKALSRRSILVAHLIHQFQLQGRTQVFFCARNQDHLALAKDLGLETLSVEDVLGKGWLKQRIEEDEQLMLSWRAPDPTLAIDKPAVEVAALTATSFNANEYEQSLLHQVALESAAEREEKLSAKRKAAEEAKEMKEEYAKFEKAAAGGAAAEEAEQAEGEAPEEKKQKKKKKKKAKDQGPSTAEAIASLQQEQQGEQQAVSQAGWASKKVLRGAAAEEVAVADAGEGQADGSEPVAEEAEVVPVSDAEKPAKMSSWGKMKPKKQADEAEDDVADYTPDTQGVDTKTEPADSDVGVASTPDAELKPADPEPVVPASDTPPVDADAEPKPADGEPPASDVSGEADTEAAKPARKSSWGKMKPKKQAAEAEDDVADYTPDTPAVEAKPESDADAGVAPTPDAEPVPASDTPATSAVDVKPDADVSVASTSEAEPKPDKEPVTASDTPAGAVQTDTPTPEAAKPARKSSWGKMKPKKQADEAEDDVADYTPATPAADADAEPKPADGEPVPASDASAEADTEAAKPAKKSSWGKMKPKKQAAEAEDDVADYTPDTPAVEAKPEPADSDDVGVAPAPDAEPKPADEPVSASGTPTQDVQADTEAAKPARKSSWGKMKPKKQAAEAEDDVADYTPATPPVDADAEPKPADGEPVPAADASAEADTEAAKPAKKSSWGKMKPKKQADEAEDDVADYTPATPAADTKPEPATADDAGVAPPPDADSAPPSDAEPTPAQSSKAKPTKTTPVTADLAPPPRPTAKKSSWGKLKAKPSADTHDADGVADYPASTPTPPTPGTEPEAGDAKTDTGDSGPSKPSA